MSTRRVKFAECCEKRNFRRYYSRADGIGNEESAEEEEVWEENENSRTTSVKFSDDVENEKTKEVSGDAAQIGAE